MTEIGNETEVEEEAPALVDEGRGGNASEEGQEEEEEEVIEPTEHLARSRPFAKKVAELEKYTYELGDRLLVRFDEIEARLDLVTRRLNDFATEVAGVRKMSRESDATQLRALVKKQNDNYRLHLENHH